MSVMDLPPPIAITVCIGSQPDYPPGTHVLTMKTLKQLGKIAADYEKQEAHRLKFETSLAKECPELNFKPAQSIPDSEIGVLVVFKHDCPPDGSTAP